MADRYMQSGRGRVFFQRYGASPGNPFEYQGCGSLTGFSEDLGDIDPVTCPSPDKYDSFEVVDQVQGEGGLPTTSLVARFGMTNRIFDSANCNFGIQVHYGQCQDPTDFINGWDKILAFDNARFTSRSSDDLTALEEGDRATINLTGDITARAMYVLDPMVVGEAADEEISTEVVAVEICDHVSCGECGRISDGCNRTFAVTQSSGLSSPALPSEVIWSDDGGSTWADEAITSMASDEAPADLACAGNYIVVPSEESGGYHYAPISDLTDWTHVTTGFTDNPTAVFALSSTQIWFVGDTGNVYFTNNLSAGVEIQSDGSAAGGSRLNDVFAASSRDLLAVGASNTIVVSENGGVTWVSVTGPTANAGVDINTVWMRSKYQWLLGTAGGQMFYTLDAGSTWAEKGFPGSGSGEVNDVAFSVNPDSPFGFLAHETAGAEGRILRTIDGGNQWYILPEGVGAIPENDGINSLAVCRSPNYVVGGGLGADGSDGILVIGS